MDWANWQQESLYERQSEDRNHNGREKHHKKHHNGFLDKIKFSMNNVKNSIVSWFKDTFHVDKHNKNKNDW